MATDRTVYGLRNTADESQVPLKSIEVRNSIQGFIANVDYLLTYANEEAQPIEASFVFPLDDKSAIYKFEAEIDGRLIVGECQDKDQARETYDDAIASGQSAFLMEESEETGDIFECLVGNLPPGEDCVVRFAYVIELDLDATGAVCFLLPSVIGPRYSHVAKHAVQPPDANPAAGPAAKKPKGVRPKNIIATKEDLPYTFHFETKVLGEQSIASIESGNEADRFRVIYMDKKRTKAKVDLLSQFLFDHDLKLVLKYSDPFHPHVVMEMGQNDGGGFLKENVAMLNFCPDLTQQVKGVEKGEYIFVVDRSGSMHGSNIQQAGAALAEFLKVLPSDSYFNIVSFGSNHSMFFTSGSQKHTAASKGRAMRHAHGIKADMGGTEIRTPLEMIFKLPPITGYPRQIFLLTDGCVYNTSDVIKLVKQHSAKSRVFTFGIGDGVSTSLVRGLARAGRGKYEIIADVKNLPEKVKSTLASAMQPCVQDVSLEWTPKSSIACTTIPSVLPPIFSGERMIVFVLIRPKTKTSGLLDKYKVTLRGNILGQPVEHSLEVTMSSTPTAHDAPVHRLAAKTQIKELTDGEDDTENKDAIIMLSTCTNVVSKYTAFVGVDKERTHPITGEMQERDVPSPMKKSGDTSAAIAASAPQPSVSYGGAAPDAPGAYNYIWGKETFAPPESLFKGVSLATITTDTKGPKDVQTVVNEATSTWLRSAVPDSSSPKTGDISFVTHPRKHVHYPFNVKEVVQSGNTCVRLCDGVSVDVKNAELLSASLLYPGDKISILCNHCGDLTAMVLEYMPDEDRFLVALPAGEIISLHPTEMSLTADTASEMKTRHATSKTPKILCYYPWDKPDESIELTTSDLAELRYDGWISSNLVLFYLRHLWAEVLSDEERAVTHCFPPDFFESLVTSMKTTRQGELKLLPHLALPWTSGLQLASKRWIFVPIFEITHWWAMLVKIEWEQDQRVSFYILDSYFQDSCDEEVRLISIILKDIAQKQGLTLNIQERAQNLMTPIQKNYSDCGVCMLQNIAHVFKDQLDPRPHLDWYTQRDLDNTRRQMAQLIMAHQRGIAD